MIPEYKYQVKDYSIITPPFKEYIVKPLIKFVPWWIPANIITIISNACMYIALVISLYSKLPPVYNFFLAAILIFAYAVGDHIDGMQAKRTKTSSALGEFFDHYLDAFNTGILLMIIIKLFGITNIYFITFFIAANYLAHASVFYEQYKTGWLIFEKTGSLEAVLLTSLILLASCIPPVNEFLVSAPLFNLKVIELIFLFSTVGTVVTFVKTLIRAKITELNFYVFCSMLIIVSLLSLTMFGPVKLFLIITLFSGYYIGSLMRGHLADGKERLPDFVVPSILSIAYFAPNVNHYITLGYLVILFLTCCAMYTAFRAVYTLRAYWVWCNPQEVVSAN